MAGNATAFSSASPPHPLVALCSPSCENPTTSSSSFFLGLLKGSLRKKVVVGTIVLLLVSILLLFPYTYSVVLIVAFTASQQKVSVDRDAFKSYTKPLERTSDYFDLCRISEYHMCIAAED